jgi:pimeloyl-ACP methyl ester carboxylesterase
MEMEQFMPQKPSLLIEASGPVNAPLLLFLHGGGAGGWMWQEVIARLPEYHCLSPDMPGHGDSRAGRPFSIAAAAERAAEVIQSSGKAKAMVIGLSEGAQVAVQMLATCPKRVESALISSALLRPVAGTSWLASESLLRWTYRLSVAPLRGSDFWIRLNMKYSAGLPESYFLQFKDSFQAMDEDTFTCLMLENLKFRLPPGLERATAPVLVIAGHKEYKAMRESARELAAALPNARAMTLDLGKQASLAMEHNWACYAPDLFARTVRAWIEKQALPPQLKDRTA